MDGEQLTGYIGAYHAAVYRVAYSYLKNRADAEDVCQETFLRLYRFSGEFPTDDSCKAWLFRVAVNLSKNLLRSGWRTKRAELTEDIPCESEEDLGLLESVMSLPPKYRVTIHLYYYEGYSVKEIADITGAAASSVTTRLMRGRERLKEMLLKEDKQ